MDPGLEPFRQHLTHHAIWDKAGNEETTHDDVMRAMRGAKNGGRIGYAVSDDVLLFAQGGYERLDIDAVRTVRAQACVPPNGCLISRTDFSFDEDMWTAGVGVDWAATENLRLRAQYTYGDSDSYDRNRLSLAAAFQF